MEANFEHALENVLEHEGGWADHPEDPGGATMRGVTLKVFREFYGEHMAKSELRDISVDQLGHIYKTGYWDKVWGDKLPTGVDDCAFDAAVNSGVRRSVRWLQQACNTSVDGYIGPNTLSAVQSVDPIYLIDHFCDARLEFLQSLDTWKTFGRGWGRRVEMVRKQAKSLVLSSVNNE